MRVIAGIYKGRKLAAPPGRDIRPTTDKTKEAMFSILTSHVPEAKVLDLFSGTGALGIEALSRGASSCFFCEKSKTAVAQIQENLEHCGIEAGGQALAARRRSEGAVVIPGDVMRTLERLEGCFDVILMDPPYGQNLCEKAMEIISERGLLAQDGIMVCEHRREDHLPDTMGDLIMTKSRRYGISILSIYEHDED